MFHVKHRRLALVGLLAVALIAVGCGGIQQPDGWASPVQIGDRLLVQARSGQLSLIDPSNGQPAWQYPTDDFGDRPFYSTPVRDGDFLYLADYKGRVTRLDISGGHPVVSWVVELDGQLVATPLLRGDSLFVPSEHGDIAVIDAASGGVTRVVRTSDRRIWSSPVANGGSLYVTDLDNGVTLAFDVATGERVWEQSASGPSAADLTLDGSLLLVGAFDRSLHALDVDQGGAEQWAFPGDGWFMARPMVDGQTVYAATMRGSVYAVDRETGAQRWAFTAEDGAEFRAAPALVDGNVVVAARDGRVFALDSSTGNLAWSVDSLADGSLNADPLVDGENIYYVTSKHNLVRVTAGSVQTVPLAAAR